MAASPAASSCGLPFEDVDDGGTAAPADVVGETDARARDLPVTGPPGELFERLDDLSRARRADGVALRFQAAGGVDGQVAAEFGRSRSSNCGASPRSRPDVLNASRSATEAIVDLCEIEVVRANPGTVVGCVCGHFRGGNECSVSLEETDPVAGRADPGDPDRVVGVLPDDVLTRDERDRRAVGGRTAVIEIQGSATTGRRRRRRASTRSRGAPSGSSRRSRGSSPRPSRGAPRWPDSPETLLLILVLPRRSSQSAVPILFHRKHRASTSPHRRSCRS